MMTWPGTLAYFCEMHPRMQVTLVVEGAPTVRSVTVESDTLMGCVRFCTCSNESTRIRPSSSLVMRVPQRRVYKNRTHPPD